jgi:mRNA-degrading endonuclease RelE of RelBE toxin-antitoxin system
MAQLSRTAHKDLLALSPALQEKARALIVRLDEEPGLGKKLLGKLAGLRSVYLGRTHRIIYKTDPVIVVAIPNRRDAYR